MDKLIYNDFYETIDLNLTDCTVGAGKQRNICDNIFVMSAIIDSIKKGRKESVNFQIYDVKKC